MGVDYSHETYESTNRDQDGTRYKATFASEPFNQGTSRYAFKGILDGRGPRDGDACVTKVFKKKFAEHFYKWVPNLAASKKALKFAKKFNSDCIPILKDYTDKSYKGIDFVIPLIAKVGSFNLLGFIPIFRSESLVCVEECVAIEPFLDGDYKNFNSNIGYEDACYDLLLAFSHWTWCISDHKFMVCDLHGIETKRKFILTDPAVHSLKQKYGMSDLGATGMEMFLANHNCNSLCRRLGLETPEIDKHALIPLGNIKSTMYRFELPDKDHL